MLVAKSVEFRWARLDGYLFLLMLFIEISQLQQQTQCGKQISHWFLFVHWSIQNLCLLVSYLLELCVVN